MSIESVFVERFEESIDRAYVGGAQAAPFAGFGFGLGASLTYVAEGSYCFRRALSRADSLISALMFYVGAILIANGRYTFVKMIEVFTLIIFSVTFSSQIMTYRQCSFFPAIELNSDSLNSATNDEIDSSCY